ncbi:hypothetical protein OH491_16335 [Termitidicoccus mucosus]|uniref:glycerophosphoryl diester phosphodiesterase membrane domain-containing protein n=1 Tax=Termitidicoccus mucosus TaxID=1184151 RepID=UPI002FEE1D03
MNEQEWKTLGDFPELAPAAMPPSLPAAVPARPAGPQPAAVEIDADAYAADLIARAAPLNITSCLSRSWAFYKSDFWPILGVTLAAMLLMGAVPLGALFLTGLFMGGLYYYYLGKMRGQQRQIGDIFIGFSRMTKPLFFAGLIMCGISFAIIIPGYGALLAGALAESMPVAIAGGALLLAGMLATMYLSLVWAFAFPLILDKNLGHRDAMKVSRKVVSAQFWRLLGLSFLCMLLYMVGMLALIVGAYFVLPLLVGAFAHAYEDLCNPPESRA